MSLCLSLSWPARSSAPCAVPPCCISDRNGLGSLVTFTDATDVGAGTPRGRRGRLAKGRELSPGSEDGSPAAGARPLAVYKPPDRRWDHGQSCNPEGYADGHSARDRWWRDPRNDPGCVPEPA